jgi:N4-gp56 family major capsid protein
MARTTTTSSTLTPINAYINKKGLSVAEPLLAHASYGEAFTIPAKNSKTIKFRRYERIGPLDGATAPSGTTPSRVLVEGVTPDNSVPTITDISVATAQLGQYFQYSDLAEWIDEVDVDENLMKRNSENMAQTMDAYYRENIIAGTNYLRLADDLGGVGAATANVAGRLNAVALTKVIRTLETNMATTFKAMVKATDSYNTMPVRPAYIGICAPNGRFDLDTIIGFANGYTSVERYGQVDDLLPGEVGAYKSIRFISTTQAKNNGYTGAAYSATLANNAANNLVMFTLVVGKEAYATVKLGPNSGEVIYIPASQRDKADPLGQYTTLGWKATCGSGILNDSWMVRIEHAVSV